jgi:hypothetical protein
MIFDRVILTTRKTSQRSIRCADGEDFVVATGV